MQNSERCPENVPAGFGSTLTLAHSLGAHGASQSNAPLKVNLAEISERQARRSAIAVIAEFGGEKRQPMLVSEDDPANNEIMLRLANEALFLRDQTQLSPRS
jgi:hypothetical protein